MKSQQPTTIDLPTDTHWMGLTGDFSGFINYLNQLGSVYLQSRTDGGGIGKFASIENLFYDPETRQLSDPANGLCISLKQLVAIHATQSGDELSGMYSIDFEFNSRPAGFSIYVMPSISTMKVFQQMLSDCFQNRVASEEITQWRDHLISELPMCPKCEKAADIRVQFPDYHPIYDIILSLIHSGNPVHTRMLSSHTDLTDLSIFDGVNINAGIISIHEAYGGITAINMRNLHAMVLKEKQIDSSNFAAIEIYNSHGIQSLEFLVEDTNLLTGWEIMCQSSRIKYPDSPCS